jgi:DNA-binding protein H-NS
MTKTYAQLAREIQALQAHAEKLRQSETKDVIARLNASIAQYGLSAQDLHFPGASASSSSASSSRSARSNTTSHSAGSSDGAKYSDGPGRVWGGRGPRPAWLREAMAQGRSLESFAVTGKTSRGGTGGPAPAKVSLPPLYAHPKTGQTWSGRGPKPAWLKQGLKKRGASVEDFLISAQGSAPASGSSDATQTSASAPATPVSRKVDGKKTGTAKTGANGQASKKSLAEKVAERTQAAPVASNKTATAAPAKKSASAKSVSASTAPTAPKTQKVQKAPKSANKADGAQPAEAADAQNASSTSTPATPAAPMKKSSAKTDAKSATNAKGNKSAKPPTKRTAPARKNLPASMAPTSEPAPVPPATPAVSLPGSGSSADESQTAGSGN